MTKEEARKLLKDLIDIYWSDLGINQWQSESKLGDDFSKFNKHKKETIIVPEKKGQILIPMPSDALLPKTEKEIIFVCTVILDPMLRHCRHEVLWPYNIDFSHVSNSMPASPVVQQ